MHAKFDGVDANGDVAAVSYSKIQYLLNSMLHLYTELLITAADDTESNKIDCIERGIHFLALTI